MTDNETDAVIERTVSPMPISRDLAKARMLVRAGEAVGAARCRDAVAGLIDEAYRSGGAEGLYERVIGMLRR
jgi:hypothetical protein